MKTRWISSIQDRPRCRASEGDGRRCREAVLWDERTNRPLSTRCGAHGGLADAALLGESECDLRPTANASQLSAAVDSDLTRATMSTRIAALGRPLRRLPALALAAALCLCLAAPALADFESAVAAYENGSYEEAQSKFESLASAGDERAEPYLERIRGKLNGDTLVVGAGAAVSSSGLSESAEPGKAAPDRTTSERGFWSASDRASEYASPPPVDSHVVTPQRGSIWSTIFHLPGDATVVGLQYVAHFLSADNLYRELQILSRSSDRIALSILAVGWWLVIIKVVIRIAATISRFMKVAANPREPQHHG